MAVTEPYGRWADDPRPTDVHSIPGYSSDIKGEVRRAGLYKGGQLLGHVWTDDREAAGFLPLEEAGIAGRDAATKLWTVLHDLHAVGVQATDVLDFDFFAPYGFELRA